MNICCFYVTLEGDKNVPFQKFRCIFKSGMRVKSEFHLIFTKKNKKKQELLQAKPLKKVSVC